MSERESASVKRDGAGGCDIYLNKLQPQICVEAEKERNTSHLN